MSPIKKKSYLPYVLSVVILVLFARYIYRNVDRYRQILDLSPNSALWLIGLALAFNFTKGLINYLLYRGLGVPLTLNESIGLAAVNTLANLLPFAGGIVAKGIYLKQRHKLAYTRFLSATLALYVCSLAVSGVLSLTVLAYWKLVNNENIHMILILGFSSMTVSILSLWLPLNVSSTPSRWKQRLAQLLDGWQVLSRNWILVGALLSLQIVMALIFAGRFWIAFHTLSQDVTVAQCILFSSGNVLTTLVTITPGGLGVREGIVAGVASLLGFEAGVSVVAVGIDRLVATLVVIALGTVYTYVLSRKVTNVHQDGTP